MRQRQLMFAVMGLFAFLGSANADSISFGVRVGPTSFSYNARPWAPAYHPYHPRPYPVYVAPAPVYYDRPGYRRWQYRHDYPYRGPVYGY